MTFHPFKFRPAPLALALALAFGPAISHAQTDTSRVAQSIEISIASQPLAQALNDFARQTQMELFVQPSLVAGKTAPAISGQFTAQQALDRLLVGSGLTASMEGRTVVVNMRPAQTSREATTLPAVVVTAGSEVGYVANSSAGGFKTNTPIVETPQSISVITREQLEDQKPRSIPEALNYTPGTFTGLVGSSNRYDYIALRGFADSSVDNSVLDGLRPLNDMGSYNSMQVDPYFLERIDVIRGPASVLYGRASPGGLIALTSRKPQFTPQREVQVTVGNRDRREAAFDVTGPIDDNGVMAYRLTGLARSLDSQFKGVEEERIAIAPSIAVNISKNTHLLLQAYLQRDPEGSYHSGVPANASITDEQNGKKISRYFFDGDPSVDKFERNQNFIGYQFEHSFNESTTFRQNFRYVDADNKLRQVYQSAWAAPGSDVLNRAYSGADESTKGFAIDNQAEVKLKTGEIEHTFLTGLDYQKRRVDGTWDWGSASPIDPYDPSYGNPGVTITGGMPIDRQLRQTGIYLQDQLALGGWRFTVGGRYDRADISNQAGTGAPAKWEGSKFTKRLGAVYLFDNGLAPYIGYSDGFNPSLRNDQFGNNLPPAESSQTEVGIRYQPKNSNTLLSAALYDLDQKNVATGVPGQTYVIPAGRVRSRGLELEARSQVRDNLALLASYTYTNMEFIKSGDGFENNTPYQAPEHMASVWGDWTFMPGYTLGGGVRYIGTSWGDNENTIEVPAYTLADLMFRVDLEYLNPTLKGLSLRLAANNLFDKTYVASCMNAQYCYWGDARNVTATLSYQW